MHSATSLTPSYALVLSPGPTLQKKRTLAECDSSDSSPYYPLTAATSPRESIVSCLYNKPRSLHRMDGIIRVSPPQLTPLVDSACFPAIMDADHSAEDANANGGTLNIDASLDSTTSSTTLTTTTTVCCERSPLSTSTTSSTTDSPSSQASTVVLEDYSSSTGTNTCSNILPPPPQSSDEWSHRCYEVVQLLLQQINSQAQQLRVTRAELSITQQELQDLKSIHSQGPTGPPPFGSEPTPHPTSPTSPTTGPTAWTTDTSDTPPGNTADSMASPPPVSRPLSYASIAGKMPPLRPNTAPAKEPQPDAPRPSPPPVNPKLAAAKEKISQMSDEQVAASLRPRATPLRSSGNAGRPFVPLYVPGIKQQALSIVKCLLVRSGIPADHIQWLSFAGPELLEIVTYDTHTNTVHSELNRQRFVVFNAPDGFLSSSCFPDKPISDAIPILQARLQRQIERCRRPSVLGWLRKRLNSLQDSPPTTFSPALTSAGSSSSAVATSGSSPASTLQDSSMTDTSPAVDSSSSQPPPHPHD